MALLTIEDGTKPKSVSDRLGLSNSQAARSMQRLRSQLHVQKQDQDAGRGCAESGGTCKTRLRPGLGERDPGRTGAGAGYLSGSLSPGRWVRRGDRSHVIPKSAKPRNKSPQEITPRRATSISLLQSPQAVRHDQAATRPPASLSNVQNESPDKYHGLCQSA